VSSRFGEGVGEGARRGAVPVGLSEMSKLKPQAGQERGEPSIGAAQEGQVNMAIPRARPRECVPGSEKASCPGP
jgi:hypothetical protein